jgi:hypothetical protein
VVTFLGHLSLLYVMPALATTALSRAFGKSGGDQDDEEQFLLDVGREMLSSALNTMVVVRELSAAAQIALGLQTGARGYEGPAGLRPLSLVFQLAQQVRQGEADEALAKAVNALAGVLFRYPAGQVQRTIDGAVALSEDKTENPAALLFGKTAQAK